MEQARVLPDDEFNQALVANVYPPDWQNPVPAGRYDLLVIVAGTAGLVTAVGAFGLGARVALIERHLMGGACLTVGCVPSKCVIRSARLVGDLAAGDQLGVHVAGATVDFPAVMARMRRLRARISANDSVQRFSDEKGVDVFLGEARFSSPDTVAVGDRSLCFKRAVIATGARAAEPPIAGLADVGFLTNESVFSLTERPRRLAVIGGGPIGCELAQAFQRLGCQVTLLHRAAQVLEREDADAAAIIERAFVRDGMRLVVSAEVMSARRDGGEKVLRFRHPGGEDEVRVDEILVGAGRAPNVEGLGLESVGVQGDRRRGAEVDDHLRTTNPRIFAAGDVCMEWKFTTPPTSPPASSSRTRSSSAENG
jgi:pyruvate/2-oxoglutarate dehydrogenase complex dihydrolipoamide dehydrogenase (E3) component